MKPIETIEKEVPGMIGTKKVNKETTVIVKGELFEEKIVSQGGEDVFARVSFINKDTGHLIGTGMAYFSGVKDKVALEEVVNGAAEQINSIIPCL